MRRVLRAAASPAYLGLLVVVVAGFIVRVQNNGYGLPYVYNVDEGSHFTARSVGMGLSRGTGQESRENPGATLPLFWARDHRLADMRGANSP